MSSEGESLDEAVAERFESEQVPWLAALVDQPSFTRDPADVEAAAELVDAALDELGFQRQLYASGEPSLADHRLYTSKAAGKEKCPALVGHVDTVFPKTDGIRRFAREGDIATGPGVLDMKSGISAMVFALKALRSVSPAKFDSLPLRVAINTDEEDGSPTSRALFDELAPLTSEALVFEAGRKEDGIITARKGVSGLRVSARGRAAHSGLNHAEGVNAIAALSRAILAIEALTDYERGLTFNVGVVRGGSSKNTVAASAECLVDIRFLDPSDGESVADLVRNTVAQHAGEATLEVEPLAMRFPLVETDANAALRERYLQHAKAVGLKANAAPLQGGGSDANILGSLGVPCIDGLGPFGRFPHRLDEYCELSSLMRRTQALCRMLAGTSAALNSD